MRHKSMNAKRVTASKKIEDVGREMAARFLASLKKALGADTLEGMHRVSWRHYLSALIIPILLSSLCAGGYCATEAKVAADASIKPQKNLSSVEKTSKKLVKKTAQSAKADEKKKKEKIVEKAVKGTVMFIRKKNISIEYSASEAEGAQELYLTLDPKVKLERVKDFSKIKRGDQVEVKYRETYLEPEKEGGDPFVISMVGTKITLLKTAVLSPETQAIVTVEKSG